MAAVAAPVMAPAADLAVSSFGDSILLEIGMHAGFKVATEGLDELVIDEPIQFVPCPHPSNRRLPPVQQVKRYAC